MIGPPVFSAFVIYGSAVGRVIVGAVVAVVAAHTIPFATLAERVCGASGEVGNAVAVSGRV
jgi:hypothetical protein